MDTCQLRTSSVPGTPHAFEPLPGPTTQPAADQVGRLEAMQQASEETNGATGGALAYGCVQAQAGGGGWSGAWNDKIAAARQAMQQGQQGLYEHYLRELEVMVPTMVALGYQRDALGSHSSPAASLSAEVLAAPPPPAPIASRAQPVAGGQETKAGANPFSREAQQGALTDAQGKRMAEQVAQQLMEDFGLTQAQAAGVVGNLWHESAGMNANVNEFGSDSSSPTYGAPNATQFGYGWAQWTADRKSAYLAFCDGAGLDPASPYANYEFLKHELGTTESATLLALRETQTAAEAAVAFRKVFERAANPVDESRIAAAQLFDQPQAA